MITDEKMQEFQEVCRPVVEWLQVNGNPMMQIIIEQDFARLWNSEMGVPFEVRD